MALHTVTCPRHRSSLGQDLPGFWTSVAGHVAVGTHEIELTAEQAQTLAGEISRGENILTITFPDGSVVKPPKITDMLSGSPVQRAYEQRQRDLADARKLKERIAADAERKRLEAEVRAREAATINATAAENAQASAARLAEEEELLALLAQHRSASAAPSGTTAAEG